MGGVSVIDRFLEVFASYIDSGFGLLGGDVAFLATTLIVIDITLAALFWAWGTDDDIIARLEKKTLFVGVFAYIIGNWNTLARIVFDSFAGLGLVATGGTISAGELLQPGRIAQVGLEAGQPILASIADLSGFVAVFENIESLVVPIIFAYELEFVVFGRAIISFVYRNFFVPVLIPIQVAFYAAVSCRVWRNVFVLL